MARQIKIHFLDEHKILILLTSLKGNKKGWINRRQETAECEKLTKSTKGNRKHVGPHIRIWHLLFVLGGNEFKGSMGGNGIDSLANGPRKVRRKE
jgi:hypothetical protein